MKKILILIAFLGFQIICLAQKTPIKISAKEKPRMIKDDDIKVSYEFTLRQISIAEATRNRIDNNDCRQTWGEVEVKFYELDANNQIKSQNRIQADLDEASLFNLHIQGPSHRSNSYYQDRIGYDDAIKRISVRVS